MAQGSGNISKGNGLQRVLRMFIWVVAIAYFPVMMSFIAVEKSDLVCSSYETKICNESDDIMITREQLRNIVRQTWPDIEGKPYSEMNLHEMEQTIERLPVVKNCEIYTTPGGKLHVEVLQREPVMHVFTSASSFYMDKEQYRVVAQRDMQANAVVVNGHVNSALDSSDLVELCLFIRGDSFWRSQIEQIYVTEKHEYILVPRVGDHIIEFGGIEDMETKFENLYTLYHKGWQPHEWNLYKKINLKYKGQVICTKRS